LSRAREIASLILDVVFKLGGFVVFIAQGLSGRAGERPITLIVAAFLMGVGEFAFPYGLLDVLGRRRSGGNRE
jgi:hypothetical protein